MASRIDLSFFLSLISLLSPLEKDFVWQSLDSQHFHTVQLSSLLPSSTCNPSSIERNYNSAMEVVHKYGPCSHLHHDSFNFFDLTEQILEQDQLRAEYVRSLLISSLGTNDTIFQQGAAAATNLPVKPGKLLNAGSNFFVTVGLGRPAKSLSLEIDTGSDLTWTQCKPCPSQDCYKQKEDIYDPLASSSYATEPCTTAYCSLVMKPGCSGGTCTYRQEYADRSYTEGSLAKDTLTLTPSDVVPSFLFGCGHKNKGLFRGTAGLLGLGRGKTSIIEQAAQKHKRLFSYCLPTTSSSTGYLIFGGTSSYAAKARYTPLITLPGLASSFYILKLTAITVAGVRLDVADSAKTIIDSGNEISRLPAALQTELSSEFRKHMDPRYPRAPSHAKGVFDTCYDVGGTGGSATFPKMSLSLEGGVVLDLLPANIVTFPTPTHACLAFIGSSPDGVIQLGNVQHLGFEVVHDISGARIGFRPNAC